MENENKEPVTQTEEKTEETVTESVEKAEKKEEKTFTQEEVNAMLKKENAKMSKKYEGIDLDAYKEWKENQKTAEQKQAEKETEYQKTLTKNAELESENKAFKAGVNKDDVDYVVFKVSKMDGDFEDNEEKLLAPDGKIYVNFLNVMSFVNDAGSIEILGNESIIALLDIPFVIRYMSKMAKLMAASSWIQCTNRPDDEIWTTNTVWAEHVSDIYKDGEVIQRGSETDILRMEQYFSKAADAYHSVILVQDPDAEKDFYLDTNYTINEDGELV